MKILLKPSDDVAFDDLHLEKEPRNGDELYERWRASFIKRHICADGKVDENTFLIERDSHVVIERKDFSRRHRREIWSGKNATSANLLTPQTKTWWPVSTESSQKSRNDGSDIFEINEVLGRSFGGGDNPLLTGGLALTMFSMEALKGFPHSIRYAKMIFRYIESSEISPGFLYRRTGSHTKDASTDELLGVVLGLYYYKKALDAGVVDHSALEIQRVVSIASNIGKLLKRHGYYYLPESSDFQRIYKICEYVQLGRQRAYPFGHPLRITLEHITGESYPAKWDEYEFFYYFGHSPLDPRRLSDFPRPIFSSALEHVEAQVLKFESEVDLIPGIEKPNVTHWEFFELVLKALKNGQTVTKALNDIVSTLINTSIFYATFGVGNIIFGDEFDDLIPNVDEADTFNFVMVGEACIPLLDLYRQGSYQYNCELISSCFQSLMSLPGREENSFFAIIAARGKNLTGADYNDFHSELDLLVKPDKWQHDLPLGQIPLIGYLAKDEIPDAEEKKSDHNLVVEVRRWLDNEIPDWRKQIDDARLGLNYNPNNLWGDRRGWEKLDQSRIYTKGWKAERSVKGEGPGYQEILRYFFNHNCRDMVLEASGFDLLFGRILASYWNLLPMPRITHKLYATAPYLERQQRCMRVTVDHGSYLLAKDHLNTQYDVINRKYGGRYDNRKVKSFFKNPEKFPYSRFEGSANFIDLNTFWLGLFGGSVIGGNGRFRGNKTFSYDNDVKYSVFLNEIGSIGLDFRLQFGLKSDKVSQSRFEDPFIRPLINGVDETYLHRGLVWNQDDLSMELKSSSFNFYRFIAKIIRCDGIILEESVGNENLYLVGKVNKYIRRLYRRDQIVGDRGYLLNPHTGSIHNIASSHQPHISKIFSRGNALLLPLAQSFNLKALTKEDLNNLLSNIHQKGEPITIDTGAEYTLPRRDYYSLPWNLQDSWDLNTKHIPYPRFKKYLHRHQKFDGYEKKNIRKFRLCPLCFR